MTACSTNRSPVADRGTGLEIIVTTTVLADVVRNIVGAAGSVRVLIPAGADPHDYQSSARQIAAIARADLVVANGLGLEKRLLDILESARSDGANVLLVGEALDPIPFGGANGRAGNDSTNLDPHFWLDPQRVADAARLIGVALASLADDVDWPARAETYVVALTAADRDVRNILSTIPVSRRKLITNHDSLGYFAARYGFEILGTVVPGGTTLADPSSSDLAALVQRIVVEGVPAIFSETTESDTLARAIATEAGQSIQVVELFTGSLGPPKSEADTLIGMMLTNARRIAQALE